MLLTTISIWEGLIATTSTTLLLCMTEKPQILQIHLLVFIGTNVGKCLHPSLICAINRAWVPSIR